MKILKLLLNIQMTCKMFIKMLKVQSRMKKTILIVFDDMIADISNKN